MRARLRKNRVTKSLMHVKMTENITAQTWRTMEKRGEVAPAAILVKKRAANTSLLPRVMKRKSKRKDIAIPARSEARRKDDTGALRLQTARALFRFTKRVVGKSIGGETGAKARLRSTEEDIGDITKRKADHEADRLGNTAAVKRKGRAKVIHRRATTKAGLPVGTNRQNVVGNLHKRTRSIVGNEDLLVHRHIMKGRVRRTENVRRDQAVPGLSRWILFCIFVSACDCDLSSLNLVLFALALGIMCKGV